MKQIYNKIAEYQKQMGYDYEHMSLSNRMQMFRNYMTALSIEQAELAQELPWKPWRPIDKQPHALQTVQAREWVDCLFFLFDQAIVLRLSPELLESSFEAKLDINIGRIKTGYNDQKGGI